MQINPQDGEARFNRANLLHFIGDRGSAIEDLQMAASIYRQEGNMEQYRKAIEKYQIYSQAKTLERNILLNSIRSNHQPNPLQK